MIQRRIGISIAALVAAVFMIVLVGRSSVFANAADNTPDVESFDSTYIYNQIVNHKLPIQADDQPTYVPGWGRYYTGTNGLELRFNRAGTLKATQLNFLIDSAIIGTVIVRASGAVTAGGSVSLLSDVVLSSITPAKLKGAAGIAAAATGIIISNELFQDALKDDCIGVTIPNRDALNQILTRVDALAQLGVLLKLTEDPSLNDVWRANLAMLSIPYANADIRVWFEPCTPGDKASDIVTTPPPPVADTQPVVKAEPIPAPVQKAQPVQASSTPAPAAPPAPPPAPVHNEAVSTPNDVCWTPGPDYRTYVKPWDHSYLWFFVREHGPTTQIQTPTWRHWTQNTDGEYRLEGQYKDSGGNDMWSEGDFFSAPFWTGMDQSEQNNQLEAYDQLRNSWGHHMNAINNAPQC